MDVELRRIVEVKGGDVESTLQVIREDEKRYRGGWLGENRDGWETAFSPGMLIRNQSFLEERRKKVPRFICFLLSAPGDRAVGLQP